jgi:hypothetical protein
MIVALRPARAAGAAGAARMGGYDIMEIARGEDRLRSCQQMATGIVGLSACILIVPHRSGSIARLFVVATPVLVREKPDVLSALRRVVEADARRDLAHRRRDACSLP